MKDLPVMQVTGEGSNGKVAGTDALGEFRSQLGVLEQLAESLHRAGQSRPFVDLPVVVLAPQDCAAAYNRLLRRATVGVRSTTRLPLVGAPLWRQTGHVLEVVRSGRSWHDLYDTEVIGTDGILDHIREVGAAGAVSRTLPDIPLKLVIADDDCALLAIQTGRADTVHILQIGPCDLLTGLIGVFEMLWSLGIPIPDQAGRPSAPTATFDGTSRQVLSLLAAGATDEAIARQLGLSSRTVQRRVRRLEHVLGASTRFQAGVQAARRGLI